MKTLSRHLFAVAALAIGIGVGTVVQAASGDEASIRALESSLATAAMAKDVNAIMKVYMPGESLVVFDVVPPREYVGAKAYAKDWSDFLGMFKGPLKFEIGDLSVSVSGTMGFSHSIQRITGTDSKGQPVDLTVRVTDVYRKIKGNWLIVHEHVSVPVDLETGKPDLMSKP
jgi:ketosteroid isomerase-like protein